MGTFLAPFFLLWKRFPIIFTNTLNPITMIVITGASGKIGSKVTDALLEKGKKLRLVARHADKLKKYEGKAEIMTGDLTDEAFLTKAYQGAEAALIMLPADPNNPDVKAYQEKGVKSITNAVKNSGVKKVVAISSVGGHTTDHTGIVAGLAKLETSLKTLEGVDILFLRPSYFMENLLGNIGMIKNMGINGSALDEGKEFPLIATKDIAKVVVDKLLSLDFTGKTVQPLLGARDYSMKEVTAVLGKAIGKPELPYIRFPYDQAKAGMVQMGLSESIADSYVELSEGINTGVFNTEVRDAKSTTPTTIEEFAQTFASAYNMN
jgi:uncharacterized protein YbjT (DUF2867 family)